MSQLLTISIDAANGRVQSFLNGELMGECVSTQFIRSFALNLERGAKLFTSTEGLEVQVSLRFLHVQQGLPSPTEVRSTHAVHGTWRCSTCQKDLGAGWDKCWSCESPKSKMGRPKSADNGMYVVTAKNFRKDVLSYCVADERARAQDKSGGAYAMLCFSKAHPATPKLLEEWSRAASTLARLQFWIRFGLLDVDVRPPL